MRRMFILCAALMLLGTTMFGKYIARSYSHNLKKGIEAFEANDNQTALDYFYKDVNDNAKNGHASKNGYAYAWIAHVRALQAEYGQALTSANTAIKLLPKADKIYLSFVYQTRAVIYANINDTAAAIADYSQAIKMRPNKITPYVERANLYFKQHMYALAEADYQELIKMDNDNAVVQGYIGLGHILKKQEKYEEAMQLFNKLITLYGDKCSRSYACRAECLLKLKRYEEAANDIVKALEINDDNMAYWLLTHLEEAPAKEQMQKKLKMQIGILPNPSQWHYYTGAFAYSNKQYKEAITAYKKANPFDFSLKIDKYLARCYKALGDFESALQYINYAIEADSSERYYYSMRADIYGELGETEKAISDMSKYIDLYPESNYGYYWRGELEMKAKQYKEAIEDFDLSKTIEPSYFYAYDETARCYIHMGDSAKAKAEYEQILKIDTVPNGNTCAHYAYHFLGQDDKAVDWVKKMLEKDSTRYYYDAACIYSLIGDETKAIDYLRLALEDGYVHFHHLEIDEDLNNIRNLKSYKQLVQKYKSQVQQNIDSLKEDKTTAHRVVEVPFTSVNGVTKVDCTINGLPLKFVCDTGASDVSLSQIEADFMLKNGYLSKKDIIGKKQYLTADGNISEGTVINIRQINFGGLEINDIRASVSKSQRAPLLLGQSVLQRLGKIEIDNDKRVLRITTR